MSKYIAPSMMCVNFARLEDDIQEFEQAGVDYLHFDIMDGQFVPNFTFGPDFIKAVRKMTDIPFDFHLMIQNPENHISRFAIEPNDLVSIHYESTLHVQRVLSQINDIGAKAMLAINPATPINIFDYILDDIYGALVMTVNPGFAGQKLIPSTIKKIADLKRRLLENDRNHVYIEVDGNVSYENARLMSDAGANIFVGGSSSIFMVDRTIRQGVDLLREHIE